MNTNTHFTLITEPVAFAKPTVDFGAYKFYDRNLGF